MNPPETAPRDGTVILAAIGWPWLVPAVWNAHDSQWVIANLQACPMENGTTDTYFENEYEPVKNLTAWLPIPENVQAIPPNERK